MYVTNMKFEESDDEFLVYFKVCRPHVNLEKNDNEFLLYFKITCKF